MSGPPYLKNMLGSFIFDFALQSSPKKIPDTAGSLQLLLSSSSSSSSHEDEDGAGQFSVAPTGTSSFGIQTWKAGEIEDDMQRELHRWRDKV